MQDAGFKLLFSTCNPWTVFLHSSFLFSFSSTGVMAVSWNTEILQSSLCVKTFQHIRLLQGTSAHVHREGAYAREFSLSCFLSLLKEPGGAAHSAGMSHLPPHCQDWEQRPLSAEWLAIDQEWIDQWDTDMKQSEWKPCKSRNSVNWLVQLFFVKQLICIQCTGNSNTSIKCLSHDKTFMFSLYCLSHVP